MDNQNQPPDTIDQVITPSSVTPPQTVTAVNQQAKPELNLSNGEVQALLMVNNLQASQQPKTRRPHLKLLIMAVVLLVVVVIIGLSGVLKPAKPAASSKSSTSGSSLGVPNQSDPASGSDVDNQINQDVKTCSNPLNAATVC